jgi:proteasome accessory factor A
MTITPKVLGGDFELANAMETHAATFHQSVYEASRRLLDEIEGLPHSRMWGGTSIEWGRRFLAGNGGSAYIDSDHLEINLPEHRRAADHALHVLAGFCIAQRARAAAEAKLPPRAGRISLLATVSDTQRSWGAHLNVCISRALWDALFTRKPHLAGAFAAHLATANLYTGQGQVGAGNERAECDFQLAQRPDFFEEFVGWQTTHRRPLLNLRDEAHAGKTLARMHIIFFDNTLAPVASYLKAGTTQLVLAMLEAGWFDPALLLDDPLAAAWEVSRDLTLSRPLRLAGRGRFASAVEVQRRLAELAGEFVASGEAGDAVPDAEHIVTCWLETLDMLQRRDLGALARRVDWALKYLVLERQRGRRNLSWQSPEIKALDLRYASLDAGEGLFLQLARAGQVEQMPDEQAIDRAADEPPEDTRAYLRAHLLRRLGDEVQDIDWDRVRFRHTTGRYRSAGLWLGMPDPARWGKEESDPVLAQCRTAREFIEAVGQPEWPETTMLGATTTAPGAWGRRGSWSWSPASTQDW